MPQFGDGFETVKSEKKPAIWRKRLKLRGNGGHNQCYYADILKMINRLDAEEFNVIVKY